MKRSVLVAVCALSTMLPAVPAWSQDAAVERGRQVFAESKCIACHSVAGKGNPKGVLDSVGKELPAQDIREWILNPTAMAAKAKAERKPPMKAFSQLPPADVDALVAYLKTLTK